MLRSITGGKQKIYLPIRVIAVDLVYLSKLDDDLIITQNEQFKLRKIYVTSVCCEDIFVRYSASKLVNMNMLLSVNVKRSSFSVV